MKTIYIKVFCAVSSITTLFVSCKQDVIDLKSPTTGTAAPFSVGSADFTKYVSIGNSLTAGYQAGALFTSGQANSFPKILSKQLSLAKDPTGATTLTFNQPDINSVNGYNSAYSNPGAGVILGRLVLFAADGNINNALPTPAGYPGVPAPYNTADVPTAYAGDPTQLNNLGVPGILLGQVADPRLGDPAYASTPYYNGLYARFATAPGTSTILGDAIAKAPTFFTFDLGNNDVLGYATTGGDTDTDPNNPNKLRIKLTPNANFQAYYANAISALMNNTAAKGVVATIPDVTAIPFFTYIAWNDIPLDAGTAAYVKSHLADGYNAFLAGMNANGIISNTELAKRTLTYVAGNNPILINDETLTDLSPYMAGPYAALAPYAKARQTTSADLIPLTAGAKLGTLANPNDPSTVYGVAVPMPDKYILIKQEVDSIKASTTAFNTIINNSANAFSSRIAIADIHTRFNTLVAQKAYISNGVTIMPTFVPPFGAFSEDGVHPNSRGYAYMANIFIDAINSKFGANVPQASLATYPGTGLPLVP